MGIKREMVFGPGISSLFPQSYSNMLKTLFIASLATLALAIGRPYGRPVYGASHYGGPAHYGGPVAAAYSAPARAYGAPAAHYGGYGHNDYAQPTPYDFGYDIAGDHGEFKQTRKESGDGHGNVQGSYGYTDAHGIYRQVDYVADGHGFRASVKTNEPGTDNQQPADVDVHSQAGHYGGGHYGGGHGRAVGGGYGLY